MENEYETTCQYKKINSQHLETQFDVSGVQPEPDEHGHSLHPGRSPSASGSPEILHGEEKDQNVNYEIDK